jgi:hypothetical protein
MSFSRFQVFLEYADIEGAGKAKAALHGRKFGRSPVVAVCYPEDKFANEEYDARCPVYFVSQQFMQSYQYE